MSWEILICLSEFQGDGKHDTERMSDGRLCTQITEKDYCWVKVMAPDQAELNQGTEMYHRVGRSLRDFVNLRKRSIRISADDEKTVVKAG